MTIDGPTNYICNCKCHTDPEVKHEGRCCFVCPKCHQRIIAHLYNEHVHTCSRRKRLQKRLERERQAQQVQPTEEEQPKERISKRELLKNRPPSFGSTRSRHRRPAKR